MSQTSFKSKINSNVFTFDGTSSKLILLFHSLLFLLSLKAPPKTTQIILHLTKRKLSTFNEKRVIVRRSW